MPQVYCSYCAALINEEDVRCKACHRTNVRRRLNPAIGEILYAFLFACFVTAVYAQMVHLSWSTWEKIFAAKNFTSESHAMEAAIFGGLGVFVAGVVFILLAGRLRTNLDSKNDSRPRRRRRRSPHPESGHHRPSPHQTSPPRPSPPQPSDN